VKLKEILGFDVSNQFRFEALMYSLIHGVVAGIFTNPAVVMRGGVQRL
jgi:hypothetical protein